MAMAAVQQDAARTTLQSSDGGIDGIIKEDRLGLDSIYLQAKRYTDKTVGRPGSSPSRGRWICTRPARSLSPPPALAVEAQGMWV